MNKRKIHIDKYGDFVVYGNNPWSLIPVETHAGHGLIISDAPFELLQANPLKCNSLYRLQTNGAIVPVLFKNQEMAEELLFILNKKL